MKKTELEIAVDAIKYCRSELSKFRRLILQAECEELRRQPSDEMIKQQIELYTSNNTKITELKEEKLNKTLYKWWIYFGK